MSNVYGEKKQEYDFQHAREGTKTAKHFQLVGKILTALSVLERALLRTKFRRIRI